MTKFVLKGTKTETVLGYIIALMLIVTTRCIWIYDYAFSVTQNQLCFIACIVAIIGFVIFAFLHKKISLTFSIKCKVAVITICCLVYLGFAGRNRFLYIQTFLFPLFCFLLYLLISKNKECVWNCFVNLMVLIACISLVFFIGGTILNIIPASRTATFEWAYTRQCRSFFNLYYEAQRLNTSNGFLQRNCGIFTEAPMYSFLLCMAISVEVFLKKYPNKIKCIILAVTVLTTQSTTGYLFLLMVLFLLYVNNAFLTNKMTVKKLLFIIVVIIAVFVVVQVLDQKMSFSSGSNSTQTRTDHLIACIQAWFHSPIWGVGYQNLDSVLSYASTDQGMSVGFPYMLASSGVFLTGTLVFPLLYNILSFFKQRRLKLLFFELTVMMLYFFTAVTSTPIILFFIAYITVTNTARLSTPAYSKNTTKLSKKYAIRWGKGSKSKLSFTRKSGR